jgi:hypothetical protein
LVVKTEGIDLGLVRAGEVPLLDTDDLKNPPLGHVADAWVDASGLMAPDDPLMATGFCLAVVHDQGPFQSPSSALPFSLFVVKSWRQRLKMPA